MDAYAFAWIIGLVAFACGWGWGAWWSEHKLRLHLETVRASHAVITVPAAHDQAADFLELSAKFMRQARERADMRAALNPNTAHAVGQGASGPAKSDSAN